MSDLADHFDTLARISRAVGLIVDDGNVGQAANFATTAFQFAGVLARQGKNPTTEIIRIASEAGVISAVKEEAAAAMDAKFR